MFAGVFDEFLGVPTHPLAVHAPLVLIPIAAVVAVVFAVRSDWRRATGWFAPAWVFVLVAMLFVAKESGEAAQSANNVFGDVDRHRELGDTTFLISIGWLILTVVLAAWDRIGRQRMIAVGGDAAMTRADRIGTALSVLTAVVAVVAAIWLLRTGHAGAESRWNV